MSYFGAFYDWDNSQNSDEEEFLNSFEPYEKYNEQEAIDRINQEIEEAERLQEEAFDFYEIHDRFKEFVQHLNEYCKKYNIKYNQNDLKTPFLNIVGKHV